MPTQTRQQAAKRAQLERQAQLALALRELVNAFAPDKVVVTQLPGDGVCKIQISETGNLDPFYGPGYKQRNVEQGVSKVALTEEERVTDSRESGMVAAEGFVWLVNRLNHLNQSKQALRLEIMPAAQPGVVYCNSVDRVSDSTTIVVHQKDNHYYPQGRAYDDITTAKNSCAFGSLITWLEENDKKDRLQPLIDLGIEKGVDAECLATLQNFVGGVDFSSSSGEESSCDDALVNYVQPDDDAYVALFSRIAHVVVAGDEGSAEARYKNLLQTVIASEKATSADTAPHPVSDSEMRFFVKEQDRLLKFYNQQKAEADSRSCSGSDASSSSSH